MCALCAARSGCAHAGMRDTLSMKLDALTPGCSGGLNGVTARPLYGSTCSIDQARLDRSATLPSCARLSETPASLASLLAARRGLASIPSDRVRIRVRVRVRVGVRVGSRSRGKARAGIHSYVIRSRLGRERTLHQPRTWPSSRIACKGV
eukprot:scaffold14720_cov65-Phaeocystis_antarctica.AAC.2